MQNGYGMNKISGAFPIINIINIFIIIFILILPFFLEGCAFFGNGAKNLFIGEPLTSFKYKRVEIDRLIAAQNFSLVKEYLKPMLLRKRHLLYANLRLALIYARLNKPDVSFRYLRNAKLNVDSKNKENRFLFGKLKILMVLRKKDYFERSLKIIAKLKKNNAVKPRLYYYEGTLYFYHGELLKALSNFKKVVALNSIYKRRAEHAISKI